MSWRTSSVAPLADAPDRPVSRMADDAAALEPASQRLPASDSTNAMARARNETRERACAKQCEMGDREKQSSSPDGRDS